MHGRLRRLSPAGSRLLEPAGKRAIAFPRGGAERAVGAASRARWLALYEEVRRRHTAGQGLRLIAREMELGRGTVRRFAHAASFPVRAVRAPEPSRVDAHLSWLQEQLAAGRDNASALWRELRECGFAGGPRQVQHWVSQRRVAPSKHTPYGRRPAAASPVAGARVSANSAQTLPSPKQLAWLLLQPADRRSDAEATIIARVERDTEVSRVADLLREFTALVSASGCHRRAEGRSGTAAARFADWVERAAACGVEALQTFATGPRQDGAAVRAALTLPWSSGQAEGQINRLKMLKRQMDGRAGFDLLRRRVLLAN